MEEKETNVADRRQTANDVPAPPGNTGTHWTGPNEYLLNQVTRVNFVTAKRFPFAKNADNLSTELQRLVHFEDIIPELTTLLEFENAHVCRLAHYHIRQCAQHFTDQNLYRNAIEALEREVLRPSPARRAAATKTRAKLLRASDIPRAMEFVADVFSTIGGARVEDPNKVTRRKIVGVEIPGTDISEKKAAKSGGRGGILPSRKIVNADTAEEPKERVRQGRDDVDDGAGGTVGSAVSSAQYLKTKNGKMLVGHSVFAALRRINRVSLEAARVESYFFDSGLLSVVPSTVRHCMALLEMRSHISPGPVSRYLVQRLPHKNPPANKRLHLEDLGAKVYFARLLGALAEDPDLGALIPEEAPKQAKKASAATGPTLKEALGEKTMMKKASGLFKFLFNKERVNDLVGAVKTTKEAIAAVRQPRLKRNDPLGVEFAEGLINLLKNASNRVLIEALRGLSRRRWTTWFEAPIPQAALYNSPELGDSTGYGGTDESWGPDEDEDNLLDDPDELGAFEDDLADESKDGTGAADAKKPEPSTVGGGKQTEDVLEKQTWFSRLKSERQKRRAERIDDSTPFYLRKLGHGVVPALEVIIRRIYGAMLHDEASRRFAAADATVALARAKIYGHVEEEHNKLRQIQKSLRLQEANRNPSTSTALTVVQGSENALTVGLTAFKEENHPLEPLIRPLTEILDEDPNQYVRGRAAVALAFLLGSGAGRKAINARGSSFSKEPSESLDSVNCDGLMLRYFKNYVTHPDAGRGIGLRLTSEFVDYLVYEVLDAAPDLAPSSIELVELWATTHATIGVCGRLGAMWEKVLSMGQGSVVGNSIFRAMNSPPENERVASAAAVFLRRRTLDLAVLTVGASHLSGHAVPEPLPRAIGVEMEKYFSLLWHCALLGPSAECRTFAVQALGGAAVLAGEPFRACTYERLVELVKVRGIGLKLPAESVLDCLDMLYSARERFSETRARNDIARDGSNRSKKWLRVVWQLAAESSAAAQILLGIPPPTGWQPLGPGGALDLANAEVVFGDVRDRQYAQKLKDASVLEGAVPTEIAQLTIEGPSEDQSNQAHITYERGDRASSPTKRGRGPRDALGHAPSDFEEHTASVANSHRRYSDIDDIDGVERTEFDRRNYYSEGRRDSYEESANRMRYQRSYEEGYKRDSGRYDRQYGVESRNDYGYENGLAPPPPGSYGDRPAGTSERRSEGASASTSQIESDRLLAQRMQEEESKKNGQRAPLPGEDFVRNTAANAPAVAGRLLQGLQQGIKSGSKFTSKTVKNLAEKSRR